MKSNLLSKSESAQASAEISAAWGIELPRTRNLRVDHIADGAQLVSGEGFKALRRGGGSPAYLPFLTEAGILEKFPSVTVDMGAVKFVCKGANVMRPGIRAMSRFEKGGIVCVKEESRGKFLAVGVAAMGSEEAEEAERGEVIRNAHYVSDRFWESARQGS